MADRFFAAASRRPAPPAASAARCPPGKFPPRTGRPRAWRARAFEDPADLGAVARVVGARQPVELARAAAESAARRSASPLRARARRWRAHRGWRSCPRGRGISRSAVRPDPAQSRSMKSPSGVSQRSRRQAMRGAGASAAKIVCRWPPGSHHGALYFPGPAFNAVFWASTDRPVRRRPPVRPARARRGARSCATPKACAGRRWLPPSAGAAAARLPR